MNDFELETHGPGVFSLSDQIAELNRELVLRRRLYPRWIEGGSLEQVAADRQIGAMEAALHSLLTLAGLDTRG